jgi:hypothetical protein
MTVESQERRELGGPSALAAYHKRRWIFMVSGWWLPCLVGREVGLSDRQHHVRQAQRLRLQLHHLAHDRFGGALCQTSADSSSVLTITLGNKL